MFKRQLNGNDIFVIEEFFTAAECAEQIARSEHREENNRWSSRGNDHRRDRWRRERCRDRSSRRRRGRRWIGNHYQGRDQVKVPSETLLDFTLEQDVTIPKLRG